MKNVTVKKLLIILLSITLFSTTLVGGSFTNIEDILLDKKINTNSPPLPGCMNSSELELTFQYGRSAEPRFKPQIASYNQKIGLLLDSINEEIYLDYLEGLVAYGPRVTTTNACQDAGEYIYNEFLEMGINARIQEWSDSNYFGTNIEGTIQGVDTTSDEVYIFCAHYDSVPDSPGADDDGSGVAAILTAAYYMSQFSFNHTIKFVAFSGEEQGLYGSYHYVDEALLNNDNIVAVLNADMIGFAISEEDASFVNIYEDDESSWLADFAVDISQEYNDYVDIEINRAGYSWGSDHYRFWQGGFNAVFYAEYNFNDYYHSPNDVIDNMDISYAVKISKLLIATLAELSDMTNSNPPLRPDRPFGPANGKAGVEYIYNAKTIDTDGDDIYYLFDWGNNNYSDWLGPYSSGEFVETSHIWFEKGNYEVRVKAKDELGFESQWSDPLIVNMPKNKIFERPVITYLLKHSFFYILLNNLLT
jgi:peptidase M28-like protein/PKD domain-containing protein